MESFLYGVDKLSNIEPFHTLNIYEKLVCLMKRSTQEYYNMRIIIALEE